MKKGIMLFLAFGLLALASFTHAASTYSVINTINGVSAQTLSPLNSALIYGVSAMAFSPSGSTAYAVNSTNSQTIEVINVSTNTIVNAIDIPQLGNTIIPPDFNIDNMQLDVGSAFSPEGNIAYVIIINPILGMDGRAYSIAVVNVSTNKIIANIPNFGSGYGSGFGYPTVIFSPTGSTAYVSLGGTTDNNIYVMNVSTNSIVKDIGLGLATPADIALNPSGTTLYVTYNKNCPCNFSAINTTTYSMTNISIGQNQLNIVAISPLGTLGYVTNGNNGTISVFNTATNNVVNTIIMNSSPTSIIFNPTGSLAYVTNSGSNTISVINVSTNTVIDTIHVGNFPTTLTIDPNSTIPFLYVSNSGNGTISVVDVSNTNSTTTSTSTTTTSTTTSIVTSTIPIQAPPSTTVSPTTTISQNTMDPTFVILPNTIYTSNSASPFVVTVQCSGFAPESGLNFGYAPISNSENVTVSTVTNASGACSGEFNAPWTAGSYNMQATDYANGANVLITMNVLPLLNACDPNVECCT